MGDDMIGTMAGQMTAMGVPLDSIAHIIQLALTPVFLLSGVSSLLGVITVRLGRLADQWDALHDHPAHRPDEAAYRARRLQSLARRLRALDVARSFGALAGVATCAATFALFLGALQNVMAGTLLVLLFGTSVLCTMGALIAFLCESLLSWPRRRGDRSAPPPQ